MGRPSTRPVVRRPLDLTFTGLPHLVLFQPGILSPFETARRETWRCVHLLRPPPLPANPTRDHGMPQPHQRRQQPTGRNGGSGGSTAPPPPARQPSALRCSTTSAAAASRCLQSWWSTTAPARRRATTRCWSLWCCTSEPPPTHTTHTVPVKALACVLATALLGVLHDGWELSEVGRGGRAGLACRAGRGVQAWGNLARLGAALRAALRRITP